MAFLLASILGAFGGLPLLKEPLVVLPVLLRLESALQDVCIGFWFGFVGLDRHSFRLPGGGFCFVLHVLFGYLSPTESLLLLALLIAAH